MVHHLVAAEAVGGRPSVTVATSLPAAMVAVLRWFAYFSALAEACPGVRFRFGETGDDGDAGSKASVYVTHESGPLPPSREIVRRYTVRDSLRLADEGGVARGAAKAAAKGGAVTVLVMSAADAKAAQRSDESRAVVPVVAMLKGLLGRDVLGPVALAVLACGIRVPSTLADEVSVHAAVADALPRMQARAEPGAGGAPAELQSASIAESLRRMRRSASTTPASAALLLAAGAFCGPAGVGARDAAWGVYALRALGTLDAEVARANGSQQAARLAFVQALAYAQKRPSAEFAIAYNS